MATYAKTSPWYQTSQANGYLDSMSPIYIPPAADDVTYQIDPIYNFRPDRLSFEIYNTPKLWWVFAMRNPNQIQDPVFDFIAGNIIMVPTLATVQAALGI